MPDATFAFFNVGQLVTCAPGCHRAAEGEIGIIRHAGLAAVDGKVVWVGPMDEMEREIRLAPSATVVNTHGGTVLPGFVDPHTHPVFAGSRTGDFYARALGQSYQQQLASGGIRLTIAATRAATEDQLLDLAFQRGGTFLEYGTTTIGAKTGYGLTLPDELKSLDVLNRLQRIHPLKMVPTFLGAHIVPPEFEGRPAEYARTVAHEWLPEVRDRARIVDVWFDEGAFEVEEGREILEAAEALGFDLTAHANELGPHGGARVAAELGALSIDHAVYLDDADIAALRKSGTVAVLLPSTTLFLGSDHYAPARRLIEAGVTVALGTDFNPGTSMTQNMQLVLSLAVLKLKMTPEEVVLAATVNGAKALGMDGLVGSLQPGRFCDAATYSVADYRDIPYHLGMNLVDTVVASGTVVVRGGDFVSPGSLSSVS